MPWPHVSKAVGVDSRVLYPAATYHGGVLLATSGGTATVAVYDGIDANGDLIDYFSAGASGRDRSWLDDGIVLRRGLYVDIGSNVSAFTAFYDPTPQELG